MHGYTYGPGLIGNSSGDGLSDPPCSICREFIPLGIIELFHSLDKAEIAFLYKIKEEHSAPDIPLCDADNKTKVCLGKTLLCCFSRSDISLHGSDLLFKSLGFARFLIFYFFIFCLGFLYSLGSGITRFHSLC